MKTKSVLGLAILSGVVLSSSLAAEKAAEGSAPAPAKIAPAPTPRDTPSTTAQTEGHKAKSQGAGADASAIPPTDLNSTKAREEANRKHIRPPTAPVAIETAPPPARSEKKPAMKAPGLVWVPGHWAPVKGEWQWIAGEWDVPATPISVWIEPEYDAKAKQWNPGYWQPDREESYEQEKPQEEHTPTPKFL